MSAPAEKSKAPATSDAERLRAMMREHFDLVWRLVRRLGVPAMALEDTVQEVFVVAARRIDAIVPGSEKSYLYGTALHVAQGVRRRASRERARSLPLAEDPAASQRTPEELVAQKEQVERLDALLDGLAVEEREVFVLFELENLTLSEIAELIGAPRGTVASRLRRARSRFVRALSQERARGRND